MDFVNHKGFDKIKMKKKSKSIANNSKSLNFDYRIEFIGGNGVGEEEVS